jgi:hypothetical protein
MLAPAGTPVTQVADVLEHVKWDMVIRGCREAGATLVFHVSTGTPGAEAMTKRAEGVLVLAPQWKDVGDLLGSEAGPLMAVLGPANGDAPPVESAGEEGGVAVADVLPAPAEEDEGALAVEALPGLPEEEVPAASATVDQSETSEAFGIADLEGSQYDSVGSSEVALEGGEAPPPATDEIEIEGATEERATAAVEEIDYGALDIGVSATADSGSSAAVDLGEPDPVAGPPTELDAEASPAEVGVGDPPAEVGVGDSPAEVGVGDSPAEVGVGDSPAEVEVEDSPAEVGVEDSPVEVGVQDSLADVGGEDSLAEVGVEAPPTADPKKAAEPKRRARRSSRGLSRLKWRQRRDAFLRLLLVIMVPVAVVGGALVAVAYYGAFGVFVAGFTRADLAQSFVPPPVEFLPGLPTPQSAIMSHVLLLDLAFEIETPLSNGAALQGELPNLLFFVSPLELEGRRQFALYAGPAYTVADAAGLRDPIAVVLDRGRSIPVNPDDLLVKEAPYAFYFGEYESAVNAEGRIQALARSSIPAYALQVAYADSTTRVRVYGGAFWDELEAEEMGRMIVDADAGELILTPRRGTVPE